MKDIDKVKSYIDCNDIDGVLSILMNLNKLDVDYNELYEILRKYYEKELDICNIVFNLNMLKKEKKIKKMSPRSGFFVYKY